MSLPVSSPAVENGPRSPFAGAPADLARALRNLEQVTPAAARRAAAALQVLLEGVFTSAWQAVAWRYSRLTGGGFPVELTFTPEADSVRYATEVAGPETPAAHRLDCALEGLRRLRAPQPNAQALDLLRRVQAGGSLRYGAWVSGRHSAVTDRYKLYAEVPSGYTLPAEVWAAALLGGAPLLTRSTARLAMVGVEPETARTEFYYRTHGLEPWEVGRLLQRAGLSQRQEELFELVEACSQRPPDLSLASAETGFSFSLACGSPTVFALLISARIVFGSDRRTRSRLLEIGAQRGWDLRAYAAASQTLAERTGWQTYHTIVSFIVPPAGPVFLQVGSRP